MESLFGGGGKRSSLKDRMNAYKADNEAKQALNKLKSGESKAKAPKAKSQADIRRDEMMAVMRDKSLSKDEKAKKIEEIKQKYAPPETVSAQTISDSNHSIQDDSNHNDGMVISTPVNNTPTNLDSDDTLSSPRPLKEEESESLSDLLRSHLRLHNTSCVFQAEADANDLLNFACDRVTDLESLGSICDEISSMELEICNEEVLGNVYNALADFLVNLRNAEDGGKKKHWKRQSEYTQADMRANRTLEQELIASDGHVSVDFSAKNAADKQKSEMESLFGGGGQPQSLKDRMNAYNADTEAKQALNKLKGAESKAKAPKAKSVADIRRDEMMAVMRDKSLSKAEKDMKMKEVKQKYPNCDTAAAPAARSSSCGASKQNSYESSPADDSSEDESPPIGGLDLSAKSASKKYEREMASLFGNGASKNLVSSSAKNNYLIRLKQDGPKRNNPGRTELPMNNDRRDGKKTLNRSFTKKPSTGAQSGLDQQRRTELQSIMKDHSLSRDERKKKMDEAKAKFAALFEA